MVDYRLHPSPGKIHVSVAAQYPRCGQNPPENENSISERVGPIATKTDKLPYFQYDVTLRGLYSCYCHSSVCSIEIDRYRSTLTADDLYRSTIDIKRNSNVILLK
ncbi:hypothetical protein TNCV_4534581 [Trichonephila clavipes]|nr:hypothetical protein TNCV_4534581 [Trichonephila clavipes]